jgi:hypothetical protein
MSGRKEEVGLAQADGVPRAVTYLREQLEAGKHWYLALLEAIGLWDQEEEVYRGRCLRYLLLGEAFDWLLLAERLLDEVEGAVPLAEREALLFYGRPPLELTPQEMKDLMGPAKYRAYLNYLYGVTVEEALHLAVEKEVRKERRCRACKEDQDLDEEVYSRIYGCGHAQLLDRFRQELGYPPGDRLAFSQLKEFTYWLFKQRVKNSHKARLASDTRKGLDLLQHLRSNASSRLLG